MRQPAYQLPDNEWLEVQGYDECVDALSRGEPVWMAGMYPQCPHKALGWRTAVSVYALPTIRAEQINHGTPTRILV